MATIYTLANRYGFAVVEDASHAIGGSYQGKPVGNCSHSSITVFSFHPVKIITTGEGGLATTNDHQLAKRMADLRSHGITKDVERFELPAQGLWSYEQQDLDVNYRKTDLQAALGLSQLKPFCEQCMLLSLSQPSFLMRSLQYDSDGHFDTILMRLSRSEWPL